MPPFGESQIEPWLPLVRRPPGFTSGHGSVSENEMNVETKPPAQVTPTTALPTYVVADCQENQKASAKEEFALDNLFHRTPDPSPRADGLGDNR